MVKQKRKDCYNWDDVYTFLEQSNYIEKEYSKKALEDAIEAWNYAFQYKDNINLHYILTIHNLLMRRLRPDIAGKLRTCNVWIGGSRKIYIDEKELTKEITEVIDMINMQPSNLSTTNTNNGWAQCCHVAFENVHPFEDGNGRVGRILMNVHRFKLGLPLLTIREDERFEYYKWFTSSKEQIFLKELHNINNKLSAAERMPDISHVYIKRCKIYVNSLIEKYDISKMETVDL